VDRHSVLSLRWVLSLNSNNRNLNHTQLGYLSVYLSMSCVSPGRVGGSANDGVVRRPARTLVRAGCLYRAEQTRQ